MQVSPWDPTGAVHVVANGSTPVAVLAGYVGLEDGRRAQAAFVDGATFTGILLKYSGRSAKGCVIRAQWAVDQWPEGWQNREVLGGALYRAGDHQGAVRELILSHELRRNVAQDCDPVGKRDAQEWSPMPRPSVFSCHFLALAHEKLGNHEQARAWLAKAVLAKNANWEDALIDRFLRREVEPIQLGAHTITLAQRKAKLGPNHPETLAAMRDVAASLMKLDRGAEAVPLIDECIQRAAAKGAMEKSLHSKLVPAVMELRVRHFEKIQDSAGCRASAEMWEKLSRTDAGSFYDAACYRAITAAVLAKDPKIPAADLARLSKEQADQAMVWLTQAVANGYANAAHMAKDADLDALRQRPDFQELLRKISGKTP